MPKKFTVELEEDEWRVVINALWATNRQVSRVYEDACQPMEISQFARNHADLLAELSGKISRELYE